jgi:hypothetical protein
VFYLNFLSDTGISRFLVRLLLILFSFFRMIHISFLSSEFYESSYSAYNYNRLRPFLYLSLFIRKCIFIQTKEVLCRQEYNKYYLQLIMSFVLFSE